MPQPVLSVVPQIKLLVSMNGSSLETKDYVAWFASAFVLLLLIYLHLLPALLAGLLVFTLVNRLTPLLHNRMMWGDGPRLLAVSIIAATVIGLIVMLGVLATSAWREYIVRLPALINRMAEIIEHSRDQMPVWLSDYMPADAEQLRRALVEWLRAHASIVQVAGADIGRVFMHIVLGMVIGALLSLETAVATHARGPFAREVALRSLRLSVAFRQVVFAQIWISGINATLTGLYLVVVLPVFGIDLPFTKTMIALTFFVGLLPILGNLISNTVIFVVSLSHSPVVAFAALAYLIVIHKLEYFLNARIIGSQIRAKAWEMLIAMLFLESAFGIPGLIAAPIYYAYMKSEFRDKGLI
ncbi:MAG TPA: AI-2E family transporter [Halioglobus sp.]